MRLINNYDEARLLLHQGKVIAYATEAVYGLGCDPFNETAIAALLALKQRPLHKGLILLIADWAQLTPLISPVSDALLAPVRASWPGPVTWLFQKSAIIPDWLSGDHDTIAIRMSAHPIARRLSVQGPVVSTSANISGNPPARNIDELLSQFPVGIEALLQGELGGASQPSAIYDVLTGKQLR